MTIFQRNKARKHKFIISGMMFGFCMSRIVTMILRITWATRPHNIHLAIAANVFVSAGVVLLFVVNLLFAQRVVRATHPHSGWHPIIHFSFLGLYVLIVVSLVALITSTIQSFYTRNKNTQRIDRDILLYGQTLYAFVSFLPFLLVIGGLVIPRKTRLEKFGSGRFRTKVAILLAATFLLCLGACFRVGVNYAGGTRPISNPAGYQSKACFYIFNFTIEITVILFYVVVRVDKRFYVPDGSHGPGDYMREPNDGTNTGSNDLRRAKSNIAPEEKVFDDDMSHEEVAQRDRAEVLDEEQDPSGGQHQSFSPTHL